MAALISKQPMKPSVQIVDLGVGGWSFGGKENQPHSKSGSSYGDDDDNSPSRFDVLVFFLTFIWKEAAVSFRSSTSPADWLVFRPY